MTEESLRMTRRDVQNDRRNTQNGRVNRYDNLKFGMALSGTVQNKVKKCLSALVSKMETRA